MSDDADPIAVEAAVPAAKCQSLQAARLPLQFCRSHITDHRSRVQSRRRTNAFTLAELLVSVFVLGVLVFLLTQLLNSATIITILGNKRMDADSQARMVFDRMAVDFSQMVKRSDVDYYLKNPTANPPAPQTNQNDQIAFYSNVPGYYPATGAQSPLSLVGYRVNSDPTNPAYNKLERLGKGLVWNGVSTTDTPAVFLPLTISATWPYATSPQLSDPTSRPGYEIIGPQVFRFEYDFLSNKGAFPGSANGIFNNGLNSWKDVMAIAVCIAVIDPRSKVLLTDADIATLNGNSGSITSSFLRDYSHDQSRPGRLPLLWQNTVNNIKTMPRQAISGVRIYERFFYLIQ